MRRNVPSFREGVRMGAVAIFLSSFQGADTLAFNVPDVGPTRCVGNCGSGGSGGAPGGGGPTPDQIRKSREDKDLQEAADDAHDRGVEAYEKGDWQGAARYFKEALEYSPDNPDLLHNLRKAEQKIKDSLAGRKLKSAEKHSQAAGQLKGEASSAEARKGFDTGGSPAGALSLTTVVGSEGFKEPFVPPAKRTPAIANLEQKRSKAKLELQALDEKIKKMDPQKDAVQISQIKQQKSTVTNQIHYYNFQIGEELATPAQVKQDNEDKNESGKSNPSVSGGGKLK